MKMLEPLKQAFRTEDGSWAYGEIHYFVLGLYAGLILGTFAGLGIILLFMRLL